MKAEELRIGNLIQRHVNGDLYDLYTVDVEILGAIQRHQNETNLDNWYKPIPLTEDFLKKVDWNGYKYLHINSNFSLDESGHLYYRGDYTGINIDYVHTLQNTWYALTGSDLTLKE